MKMSKTNRKTVAMIALALIFVITVTAISFAWFQNYVDVKGTTVKTGRMLYKFYICAKDSEGNITFITPEGASTEELTATYVSDSTKVQDSVSVTSEKIEIAPNSPSEFFFIIEKLDGSIDFDVSIGFDNDGFDPSVYDYVGSLQYRMYNDSTALCTQGSIASYLEAATVGQGDLEMSSFGNVWNDMQKGSVNAEKTLACIRMCLDMPQNTTPQAADKTIPLRVNLCAAQTGALPGEEGSNPVRVETPDQLVAFMNDYKPGDELIITQNIDYTGDLLFTRPCTITVMQSTLTVRGNILLSYIYDDEYKINTSANGHIQVLKNNGGAGNVEIDIPNCSLDLVGLNNIANGKADLYVEGNLTLNASRDAGVRFNAFRACEVDSSETLMYLDDLKPMSVSGATRIYTTHRTEIGKITTTVGCRKITIVNNGYIDGLDLREMKRDETLLASPAIDFDNYGNLRDALILLPSWAMKFNESDTRNYNDNTRIIANVGSGFMQAVSGNRTIEEGPNDFFYSNGSAGADGLRDDIIYIRRTEFVELVTEGDLTKIIVHYEAPNDYTRPVDAPEGFGSSLASIIDYYSSIGKIADRTSIVEMTVICYGDKVLLPDDYVCLRSMKSLTTLDLSDSVSLGRETPTGAFQGMTNLTHVDMPASDTVWNPYIFTGTSVEEIWFPAALQTLNNPKSSKGVVTAQQVLDGVKYVHTGINLVDGMYANINATQYFFTPQEYVYEQYRNLVITSSTGLPAPNFARRIFMEADRYGDYFLRLFEDGTCEFVTYVGSSFVSGAEASSEKQFDFETIIINGSVYTIRSYDPYAFYRKLISEQGMSITFGDKLASIGEYAFATNGSSGKGITTVEFKGATTLADHAFYDCMYLASVSGSKVTTFTGGYHFAEADVLSYVFLPLLSYVEGDAAFGTCPALQEVHIGVIERTTANQNMYTSNDSYSYAKFFIHTEYASAAALNYSQALAADSRFIFVASPYDTLYDAYTGRTAMGNHTFEELKTATQSGATSTESDEIAYYYYVNDDGTTATLVACVLPTIIEGGGDHTTIEQFTDGAETYTVTSIGSAAYHFTAFREVNTLAISENVTRVGRYAFDATKTAFGKFCVTFDLANVTHADDHALQGVSMVKLVGEKLAIIGADAIRNNTEMRYAFLPVLSTAPKGTNGVFAGNTELRFTYLGAPDNVSYNNSNSLTKQYIRFFDTEKITATTNNSLARSNVLTLINTSCVNLFELGSSKNLVYGGTDFSYVVFSDWYDLTGEVDGVNYSFELPGYIYLKDEMVDGRLKLFSVSPDLEQLDSYDSAHYVTPNELYASGVTHDSLWGDEAGHIGYDVITTDVTASPAYTVTTIGNYAYSVLRIYAQRVTVGSHTTALENNAFRYLTTGAASGMIYSQSLDLANVTHVGNYAIYQAQITELNAPRLMSIGSSAFYACRNLTSAYFPSLVEVTGNDAFYNCTGLTEVTFGENMTAFYHQMFYGASALKTITILNPYSAAVINIGSSSSTAYLFGSNTANKGYANAVKIRVPASALSAYKAKYSSNFGGVPIANFETFENAYTDANKTIFYWQEVGGSAIITAIGGTLPTGTVTLPTAVTKDSTSYTVIAVGPLAMQALTGATKIVLPAGMTSLAFTAADVPASVTALEIVADNDKFETKDGVLYDKGQHVVFVYPKGRTDESFTLPSTVTAVASHAFYGAERLVTLTIPNSVKIADRAFASTKLLTAINFMSTTASDFIGVDIFANANESLKLYVPVGTLAEYKVHVWFDHSILDLLVSN